MPVGNKAQRQTDEQRKADAECGYLFSRIPNNRAGRKFIENLRRYVNRSQVGDINVYANGPRTAAMAKAAAKNEPYPNGHERRSYHSFSSCLPHQYATSFRVYFRRTKGQWQERMAAYELKRELAAAKAAHALTLAQMEGHIEDANRYKGERDTITECLEGARSRIDWLDRCIEERDALIAEREKLTDDVLARNRELQEQLNSIPAWIITVLGWVRETTGDLFVRGQS